MHENRSGPAPRRTKSGVARSLGCFLAIQDDRVRPPLLLLTHSRRQELSRLRDLAAAVSSSADKRVFQHPPAQTLRHTVLRRLRQQGDRNAKRIYVHRGREIDYRLQPRQPPQSLALSFGEIRQIAGQQGVCEPIPVDFRG